MELWGTSEGNVGYGLTPLPREIGCESHMQIYKAKVIAT